jgi:methylated-DNA-[protein]-cysteine S-methyltransferase
MSALEAAPVETPLGTLIAVLSDNGVVATAFVDGDGDADRELDRVERTLGARLGPSGRRSTAIRREVEGYFGGRPSALRSPVDLRLAGDGFPRRVLEAARRIPFGEMATYGDVAAMAGSPRGGRAAGNALAHCPIELWVPCHRVVHADGHIGGYGRHEDRKRFLLRHEGAIAQVGAARAGRSRPGARD